MSDSVEDVNEPNTHGFGGEGSGPEPVHITDDLEDIKADDIAVPSGDLTEGISEALEGVGDRDDKS